MSEATRARRLSVQGRLQDLNAKYGAIADEPLPSWLDSLEGLQSAREEQQPQPVRQQPAPREQPLRRIRETSYGMDVPA